MSGTYLDIVLPLIERARSFVENGESLQPFAFVGNYATRQITSASQLESTSRNEDKVGQLWLCHSAGGLAPAGCIRGGCSGKVPKPP